MSTPVGASPQPDTGLPPGVEVGGLGPRIAAYLIDWLPAGIVGGVLGAVLPNVSTGVQAILGIVGGLAIIGWVLFVLAGVASRAASPGMRAMKLQIVGFYDGRPIGWARALLRAVLYWLIGATLIVWIVMIVLLLMHPRRQGWHDLAAKAVLIKQRSLPPAATVQTSLGSEQDHGAQQGYHEASQYSGPGGMPGQSYAPGSAGTPSPVGPQAAPAYGPQAGYRQPAPGQQPPYEAQSAPPQPQPQSPAPPREPRAPLPSSGWQAVLDDGREIDIDGLVLLGRNPQPQPGEEDAELIKVADETRTVSKSHLAIGLDAAGLFVVDRGSTNGSTVTTPAGVSTRCQPSQVIYVAAGSIVSIGDHWMEIRKKAAEQPAS